LIIIVAGCFLFAGHLEAEESSSTTGCDDAAAQPAYYAIKTETASSSHPFFSVASSKIAQSTLKVFICLKGSNTRWSVHTYELFVCIYSDPIIRDLILIVIRHLDAVLCLGLTVHSSIDDYDD